MNKLNTAQEVFAQEVASGATQADAYRKAYPKCKRWKQETIHNKASALMRISEVSTRVKELQAELASKQLWTREKSTRFWLEVITDDTGEFKSNDKVNAGKQLDKTHGFEQVNIDHTTNGKELTAPARIEIVAPSLENKNGE